MANKSNIETLEIIIPCYNEDECIAETIFRLEGLRNALADTLVVDFIFINDGSQDKTLDLLSQQAISKNYLKVIDLSRNFGHQYALTAGLDASTADWVAIIDADLQDPPEVIIEMYKKARNEDLDVVYGQRNTRAGETVLKKITAYLFYKLIRVLCKIEIPKNTGDFRLMRKNVVQSIVKIREKHRFVRGLVPWVGYKSAPYLYDRSERFAGTTKYPYTKMAKFAFDAIYSFSNVPLIFASYLGFTFTGLSIFGLLVILFLRFFTDMHVPGISAVIFLVLLLGGIQFLILGILGEYVGRIFEQVKERPLYNIKRKINLP